MPWFTRLWPQSPPAARRYPSSNPSKPIGSRRAILKVYNLSMVIVHHLNNSRSQRVLWLLEELGVPYEVKRYERDAKTMLAPPELLAVHPLGKSPVIVDGAATVAESGAIIEYLVGKYGDGRNNSG